MVTLMNSHETEYLLSEESTSSSSSEVFDVVVDRIDIHEHSGLSSTQAASILDDVGFNELPSDEKPLWKKILLHFISPTSLLIAAASIIAGVVRDWPDLGVMLALLALNAFIQLHEESKSNAAVRALCEQLAMEARVLRDGTYVQVAARLLVPTDVIKLRVGDVVPADCIVKSGSVHANQASLTGESLAIRKGVDDDVFSGSSVERGEAVAVVSATGTRTFFGKSAALMSNSKQKSGFKRNMTLISRGMLIMALVVVLLITIIQLVERRLSNWVEISELLQLLLVLLVASLPIAMQAVSTTTLAVGARRLAKHGAIVTRLTAIESLAAMNVLCSDKTGTLTQNILTLAEDPPKQLVLHAALGANFHDAPDAIDRVLVASANDQLAQYEQLSFEPFDPVAKRTTSRVRHKVTRQTFEVIKGAPQVLLGLDDFHQDTHVQVNSRVEQLAKRGLRPLGVMKREEGEQHWTYLGVLALFDPPRHDSESVVKTAQKLGIGVKMITGDHGLIAKDMANMLGMPDNILSHSEFFATVASRTEEQNGALVENADGFAEVLPEDKHYIVSSLQSRGYVVGMTGDGVNDAAAISEAHVGIAVEDSSDAAIAAADVVLTEPGLGALIEGISRSRKIFERIANYCRYRISVSISLLLFSLIVLLAFGLTLPSIAVVILIVVNDVLILTTAYDKVFPTLTSSEWKMRETIVVAIILGVVSAIEATLVFIIARDTTWFLTEELTEAQLKTLMYLSLALSNAFAVLVARTRKLFFTRRPGFLLLGAIGLSSIGSSLFAAFGASLFEGMQNVLFQDIAVVWATTAVAFLLKDFIKFMVTHSFDHIDSVKREQSLLRLWNRQRLASTSVQQ